MAFRVPHNLLTPEHKSRIVNDLCLKEKIPPSFYSSTLGKNRKVKTINFYHIDRVRQDVLLPLYYASQLFDRPLINSRRIYHQIPSFQMKCSLYDYQEEVVDISIKNFMTYGSTFLNVFCSYGKTVVAAYLSAMLSNHRNLLTLVTFPRTMIQNSWIGTFVNLTTAKIYVVGEDSGTVEPDTQVILCMDTRLHLVPEEIRMRVGHLVIDEADRYCTIGHVEGILSIEPLFITILTATYERDDGFEQMIDLLAGREKITRISKKPFFVFQIPTKFTVEPEIGKYGIIWNSVISQLDSNTDRNIMIVQRALDNIEEKILVLTKHYPQAVNFYNWLQEYLKPKGKTVALVAGKIKKYHDADFIVGTISKLGVGFDEKEACIDWKGARINMLILTSSTKKIEQIAGRVFRASVPIIIDIVDDNSNIKTHWRLRKKWYQSRNGIVFRMTDRFCWRQIQGPIMEKYLTGSLPSPSPTFSR